MALVSARLKIKGLAQEDFTESVISAWEPAVNSTCCFSIFCSLSKLGVRETLRDLTYMIEIVQQGCLALLFKKVSSSQMPNIY